MFALYVIAFLCVFVRYGVTVAYDQARLQLNSLDKVQRREKNENVEIANVGQYGRDHRDRKGAEEGLNASKFKDGGESSSKYKLEGNGKKASKFEEKLGHKRGHKTKGYHNTFMRDEIIREHKFYDDADRSGYYSKHGSHHEDYASRSGWKKDGVAKRK